MEETMMTMALIALRGLTVLPGETKHFDISRKKSIASLQQAMVTDQKLFLVTQKSPDVQEPSREELWNMGTIAEIRQLVKLPGNIVRVMVEGKVDGEDAYVGRTYRDAPEIDGYIFVNTEEALMTGDFIRVRVTGAYEYDLIGEVIG